MQTLRLNHGTTDNHPTEEHSESNSAEGVMCENRYVLTDDTRLARPEQLEEVEGVCRRWTCDGSVTQEQTHFCSGTSCTWRLWDANGTCSALRAFLLEATLRLASAPQRVIARMCVDRCHKSSPGLGAKAIGSGIRIANSRTSIQMTLHIANRVPIPTYRKRTFRILMISSLCSAPHDKKDNDVERYPSQTLFLVHSSHTATSTEVEIFGSCRLPALVSLHFHIQCTAWTLGYLKRVVMDVYPRLFEISSL